MNLRSFTFILLSAFCLLFNATVSSAQITGDKPKKVPIELSPGTSTLPSMNSLKWTFPAGNIFVYEYHDSTEVLRTYSDSSTLAYTREVVYFLQLRALKDPVDGVLELNVNIDSLRYRFRSGDAEIRYDNKTKMELKFPDLIAATVPVNREFNIKMSPYWEAVSVNGEMLEWLVNYINDYGEGHLDSMSKFIWFNGISTNALAQYCDIQKGALPNGRIAKDSVWKKPYFLKIDGLDCRDDSATSQISAYNRGVYTIETLSKNLKPLPAPVRVYGIESIVNVIGGEGNGKQVLNMTRKGVITEAKSNFNTLIKAQIRSEIFSQKVQSHYSWKLLGQLAY